MRWWYVRAVYLARDLQDEGHEPRLTKASVSCFSLALPACLPIGSCKISCIWWRSTFHSCPLKIRRTLNSSFTFSLLLTGKHWCTHVWKHTTKVPSGVIFHRTKHPPSSLWIYIPHTAVVPFFKIFFRPCSSNILSPPLQDSNLAVWFLNRLLQTSKIWHHSPHEYSCTKLNLQSNFFYFFYSCITLIF